MKLLHTSDQVIRTYRDIKYRHAGRYGEDVTADILLRQLDLIRARNAAYRAVLQEPTSFKEW